MARDTRAERGAAKRNMRRVAGKLLPYEAVARCGRYPAFRKDDRDAPVPLMIASGGEAYWSGLVTCGSVWHCPVCAEKVSIARRDQVAEAVRAHQAEPCGGVAYMATLTIRHHQFDRLIDLLATIRKAWGKLKTGAPRRRARGRAGWVGDIRSLEVTRGANGWHPHLHVLLFLDRDDPDAAAAFGD